MVRFPEGVCPILATPFTADGDVDYESLKELARKLIGFEVGALTLFGIAGEYYKLSDMEKERMARVVVEEVGSDVPVIVSVTRHATELAVKEAARWQELGADMLMLLPPFFLKPGPDAIEHHVEAVCEAVDLPVMLQYAPEQTGVSMGAPIFLRLLEKHPQLCFKIESKPPGGLITALVEGSTGAARIYVGNAGFQMLEGFHRGIVGVMPGCSLSDVYVRIYRLHQAGQIAEAVELHNRLLGLINSIRQNVEQIIQSEKTILKRRGWISSDYCRRPSFEMDEVYLKDLESYLSAVQDLVDRGARA